MGQVTIHHMRRAYYYPVNIVGLWYYYIPEADDLFSDENDGDVRVGPYANHTECYAHAIMAKFNAWRYKCPSS